MSLSILPQDLLTLLIKEYLGLISSVKFVLSSKTLYTYLQGIVKKRKEFATLWLEKYITPRVKLNRYVGCCVSTRDDIYKRCLQHGWDQTNVAPLIPQGNSGTINRYFDVVEYLLVIDKKTNRITRHFVTLSLHSTTITYRSITKISLPTAPTELVSPIRVTSEHGTMIIALGRSLSGRGGIQERVDYPFFADDPSFTIDTYDGISVIKRKV